MQQRPKLSQVVLQRSASQQQPVRGREHLELRNQHTLEVLDAMTLVNDEVCPGNL
jgi:hypothetical protein